MASKVSGVIEKIQTGGSSGTSHAIASTAYGYCETAADEQIKNVDMTGFKLYEGVTIHVKFANANSASNPPKLKFNSEADTNAKPIVQYGTTAAGTTSETNGWYAGAVLTLTYDGTSWVRDQGYNSNTTYTFTSGTNGFTVTPSGGTAQTVTVTPSITNNITGSGTSNYLTKFTDTNIIGNSGLTTDANNNLTIPGTIYFGVAGKNKAMFSYNATYPKYGIWYSDETNDIMAFSASGNGDSKTSADFAIKGGGTLWNKGNIIPNTGNNNGTVGSDSQPVYVNAGIITSIDKKKTANALINALDTGSSDLTANDYVITQYVGGGTTTTSYHRRPANKVINATLIKAALGTVSTTAKKFLKDTGSWVQVDWGDLTGKPSTFAPSAHEHNYIGKDGFIAYPSDGRFSTRNSHTGYIKIKIPYTKSATMFTFDVDIYNYSGDTSVRYHIGGYNYDRASWINTTAYCIAPLSNKKGNLTVRFWSNSDDEMYVSIGEPDTVWSIPSIIIHNITLNFNNDTLAKWKSGWTITIENTAFDANLIKVTKTNTNIAYKASAANLSTTQYGIAYYSDTAGTFAGTEAGTSGQYLKSNGSSAPTWATLAVADISDISTTYYKLDGSNTGTKLCISTQAAAHTNQIQFMNSTTKKGSIGTDNNGVIGVYGSSKVVLRPVLDASTKGVEVTTSAMYPTASITLGTSTAANKWSTVYATIFDGTTASLTHAQNQSDGLKIKYSTTIDYFIGVGTGNVNHGLYDNKASGGAKWILYAGSDNKWVLDASVAWSNITSKPNTISDYGITDAKIVSDVITLGSNTITPITSIAELTGSTITATNLRINLGLSSALRFIGKATTDITESTTTAPTVTGVTNYVPEVGDVVLDKNSDAEYVCIAKTTANNVTTYTWELLGRSGSWATSTHTHGNITNGGLLGTASMAVVTDGSKKITTADLSVSDSNASTNATTTFVQAVTQSAQGKITVTKASLNTSGEWSGNAATATQLAASKTLWGQSFNGSGNITGDMTDVGPNFKLPSNASTDFYFLKSNNNAAAGYFGKLALNTDYENADLTNYVLDVLGAVRIKLPSSSNTNNRKFIITRGNDNLNLSISVGGIQAYNNTTTSNLNLQYYGGNLQIGSNDYSNSATRDFYGQFDFKSTNGFTYSQIGNASDMVARPIWFSYNGVLGRPVYDNNFKYTPGASTTANTAAYSILTLGNNANISTTTAHSEGKIILYSAQTAAHVIVGAATTTTYTHTLPNSTGTLLDSENYPQYLTGTYGIEIIRL